MAPTNSDRKHRVQRASKPGWEASGMAWVAACLATGELSRHLLGVLGQLSSKHQVLLSDGLVRSG